MLKSNNKGLLFLMSVVAFAMLLVFAGCSNNDDDGGPAAPATPTGLTATAGNQQISLVWDTVAGATSFNIYYSTSAGVTKSNGTKISVTTNSYAHTGLTNGQNYYYVVTAVNEVGESAESTQITATPSAGLTAPGTPTDLVATAGNMQVALSWTTVATATSFNIYYSTTAGVTKTTGTKITATTNSYTHTGLTNGQNYYYVVTAVNAAGESAESAEKTATPAPDFTIPAPIDGGYVGTDACLGCHNGTVAVDRSSFKKSGHPYKYTHTGGQAMGTTTIPGLHTRPLTTSTYLQTLSLDNLLVSDGSGSLDWSAINYTVGGFGWKIRWGMRDTLMTGGSTSTGYVWTGNKAQFNIRDNTWAAYNTSKDKLYECGICHNTNGIVSTTGYVCETDGGTDAAPARTQPWGKNPGMGPETHGGYESSWTFDGVQCEACHGPGETHANSGTATQGKLTLPDGVTEICAKCHIRAENNNTTFPTSGTKSAECGGDADAKVLAYGAIASGNWIGHHEQYNELHGLNGDGVHASLTCTTCHDPHQRATTVIASVATLLSITDNSYSAEARGAIKVSCTSCHAGYKSEGTVTGSGMANLACIDCHMAEATKSASVAPLVSGATQTWGLKGDVKTHIFKISTDPTVTNILRTNVDSKTIATNYLTINYACGKCHGGLSEAYSQKSQSSVMTRATNYHGTL